MKKIICIIISVVMLFSNMGAAFASEEKTTSDPVIIIPGFLQTSLRSVTENEIIKKVWLPDFGENADIILNKLPELLASLIGAFKDNPEGLGEELMKLISEVAPGMRCNPDGSSIYPVEHYENDPAKRNMAYIKSGLQDIDMQAYYTFADYISKKGYISAENVFVFEYDGRMDAITVSEELRDFIKAVKSYTGKEKVTLFGVSYGGQIAETYLHFYMDENDVGKAVFEVPSFNGTNFADRILNGKVEFAVDDIMDIIESITGSDTEYNRIFKDVDPEFFNRVLNGISTELLELARYWGAVYSLTTPELYEHLKNAFLDREKSAEIIRKNDIIHYEVMPEIRNTLNKCLEKGISISVLAASGLQLALGGEKNSDLLLAVNDVTGAETAPFGKRFKAGYKGRLTNCNDKKHNHVSPSGEIDATTAFLPENTWFVDGQHHAMFQYENYGLELAAKVVCTDELKSVHSDKDFPQFRNSDNPHRGVYAEFDNSTSGYISKSDTALIIENVYRNNKIRILGVSADGMNLEFDFDKDNVLSPGEKLEVTLNGILPEEESTAFAVEIKYIKLDAISVVTERQFDFTYLNENDSEISGELIENEFYNGDKSQMSFIEKAVLFITYIFDIMVVFGSFIRSEAFRFLL